MPDKDIDYKSSLVISAIEVIRSDIESKLKDSKTEYDTILESFSTSECLQATAVRAFLAKEKEVIDALVDFYTRLLHMIEDAGNDLEATESSYSSPHLTN